MKKVAEDIYERGKRGMLYVRRRIPTAVSLAYPLKKTRITTSLGTSDLREGKVRARVVLQRIDAEFEQKKKQCDLRSAPMAPRNVSTLTRAQWMPPLPPPPSRQESHRLGALPRPSAMIALRRLGHLPD